MDQVAIVSAIYEAFGRGDVAAILERLDEDVSWDEGLRRTDLPYLQPGRGRAHVGDFFTALVSTVRFDVFEPIAMCGDGDGTVVVVVRERGANLITGGEIPEDLVVHVWRLGPHGMVVSMRHVFDLAVHEAAAAGVPVAAADRV